MASYAIYRVHYKKKKYHWANTVWMKGKTMSFFVPVIFQMIQLTAQKSILSWKLLYKSTLKQINK